MVDRSGRSVTIVEVGPRDGLQNESAFVPTAEKIAFVDRLSNAGHSVIEVSAFVSPRWVPQMADAAEVFAGITRRPGVIYTAIVPNVQGLARALAANVDAVAVFPAASETFTRRNLNQSVAEAMASAKAVCGEAWAAGLRVRGYLSVAFGCPFEGPVNNELVATLAEQLIEFGVYEVALSDTIGIAHPGQVSSLLDVVEARVPAAQLALHFHDTRGMALANVYAGLEAGVSTFDASAGGLGGCPYAPGATGNLATEDLLYLLDGLGVITGVRLNDVVEASAAVESHVGHALPSRVLRALRRPGGRA
ncbi:MAG: hydroxymethylglutaryl-CoA lyase [Acidobacteria bacterium]|nr:hydroxymethylglutaryl-CoA lyase [Acidobacteriota bacterium]